MKVSDIFYKVTLVSPINERIFISNLEDTVNELLATYGGYKTDLVINEGEEYVPAEFVSDEIEIRDLYLNPIVDNILYLNGQGDLYKTEFIRKAKDAFDKYYSDFGRGKRLKRAKW